MYHVLFWLNLCTRNQKCSESHEKDWSRKDEGKTWFPQLRDKRKHSLIIQIVEIISLSCLQNAVVKYIFTTA